MQTVGKAVILRRCISRLFGPLLQGFLMAGLLAFLVLAVESSSVPNLPKDDVESAFKSTLERKIKKTSQFHRRGVHGFEHDRLIAVFQVS